MIDLAFVLLSQPQLPDGTKLLSFLSKRLPDAAFRFDAAESRGEFLAFPFKGGRLSLMLVDMPVPNREADDGYRFSIASHGKNFRPPAHRAHIIVTAQLDAELTPLKLKLLFTPVLASVLECGPAVGVYWGSAGVTHPAEFFLDVAGGDPDVWTMVWTGVSIASDGPSRLSMLSLGMGQFGLMNIMVSGSRTTGNELVLFLLDMARYCIERGADIPDGDTIGRSAEEILKVRHVPSPIDPKVQVWRVDLP